MYKTIMALTLMASAFVGAYEYPEYDARIESPSGCKLNNKTYKVGHIKALNENDMKRFEVDNGVSASDGDAILMMCSFIVKPSEGDYPHPEQRQHVWVAYSYSMF